MHDASVTHGVRSRQGEGEKLARKNGELEAALRRVRAANRDSDAERDRMAARIASLESQARRSHLTCLPADVAAARMTLTLTDMFSIQHVCAEFTRHRAPSSF